jgi:signal transduction histidine kinase
VAVAPDELVIANRASTPTSHRDAEAMGDRSRPSPLLLESSASDLPEVPPLRLMRASDLMVNAPVLAITDRGQRAIEMLAEHPELPCFAVLDDERRPVGVVSRVEVTARLANRYFYVIHEKRPVQLLMHGNPMIVDIDDSIDLISERIAREAPSALHTGLVVTENGRYRGIGTGLAIMAATVDANAQRMQALERARELASEATRTKSRFLASMSHELRTPLNAIIGYATLLREELGDSVHTASLADLGQIEQASHHLLSLINSVLDLSKIEAGRMDLHLQTFAVDELIDEVSAVVGGLAAAKRNQFNVERGKELGMMTSDLTKLRQSLINLLGNANKFTAEGTITLRASARRQAGREVLVLAVSDTGIGMTRDQLAKLFQPFVQADSRISDKFGGTGLGLVLSKTFIEMLGGRITVDSEPGVGSTFTIHVPRVAPQPV